MRNQHNAGSARRFEARLENVQNHTVIGLNPSGTHAQWQGTLPIFNIAIYLRTRRSRLASSLHPIPLKSPRNPPIKHDRQLHIPVSAGFVSFPLLGQATAVQ